VRALRERLEGEPHTPLGHFCSPHHASSALHPVVGLLERAAGLRREDPPEFQLDRLEAMLALATEDVRGPHRCSRPARDRRRPLPAPRAEPAAEEGAHLPVLLDQLAGLARTGPVLALYEDVHWADPTTLELLGRAWSSRSQRPCRSWRWSPSGPCSAAAPGRARARPRALARPARQAAGRAMVVRVTGGKALPRRC
jgi:predicted ATPase